MNASLQVIDTGLDETLCFFIDDDGEKIEHGHYLEELRLIYPSHPTSSSTREYAIFEGGYFPHFPTRRKVTKRIFLATKVFQC